MCLGELWRRWLDETLAASVGRDRRRNARGTSCRLRVAGECVDVAEIGRTVGIDQTAFVEIARSAVRSAAIEISLLTVEDPIDAPVARRLVFSVRCTQQGHATRTPLRSERASSAARSAGSCASTTGGLSGSWTAGMSARMMVMPSALTSGPKSARVTRSAPSELGPLASRGPRSASIGRAFRLP